MSRRDRSKQPPPGEYVVRHERPYPERLEQWFKTAARVLAILAGTVAAGLSASRFPYPEFGRNAFFVGSAFALAGGLTWGSVHAVGLMLGATVTAFRRKQYVIDWQQPEQGDPNRGAWIFFAWLSVVLVWTLAARRWL